MTWGVKFPVPQVNYSGPRPRWAGGPLELAGSPYAAKIRESTNETVRRISLNPLDDILPQWKLTLDVTESGYWFMIKDTSDPCGFAFVSNQTGLIFRAEPIR